MRSYPNAMHATSLPVLTKEYARRCQSVNISAVARRAIMANIANSWSMLAMETRAGIQEPVNS